MRCRHPLQGILLLQQKIDELGRQYHAYQRGGVGGRKGRGDRIRTGGRDECSECRCACHTAADRPQRFEHAHFHDEVGDEKSDDHRQKGHDDPVHEEDRSLLPDDLHQAFARSGAFFSSIIIHFTPNYIENQTHVSK